MNIKRKEKAVAKASSCLPVKTTRSSQSVKELGQPEPKLSTMFFEIKNELLEQQQAKEAVSTDLLDEDAKMFRKLDIPWIPNDEQDTTTGKPFDSDRENMQRALKQYGYQMEYLQETNNGLILANKRLREHLQEVNEHYQELIVVSKEALKRKISTDELYTELKQTVKDLQQKNEELTKRIADMEEEQRRARKKAQALDGIALLAEAAQYL